jgi:hypothetical protein
MPPTAVASWPAEPALNGLIALVTNRDVRAVKSGEVKCVPWEDLHLADDDDEPENRLFPTDVGPQNN